MKCVRCEQPIKYMGTKKFHESGGWTGWMGSWSEMFEGRQKMDLFGCQSCGKIEFFIEGTAKELGLDKKKK